MERAVCRIIDKINEEPIGTGFLIEKEYIMTNEHVVGNNPQAFFYQFNYNGMLCIVELQRVVIIN